MMRTTWIRLLLMMSLLMSFIMLQSCASWQAPASDRPFKTIELLTDVSVMPPGWIVVDERVLTTDAHHLSVGDSAVVVFEVENGAPKESVQEYIHRYRNSAAAEGVYEKFIQPVGKTPPDWKYQSAIANESAFACYDYEGRTPYPICEWAGRFEEYIITVSAWLVPDHMSLSDLENMLQDIDSRMAVQLGKQ